MKQKIFKTMEIMILLLAFSVWTFSFFEIIKYLGFTRIISRASDVSVSVESSAESKVSGGEGKAFMEVTTEINGQKEQIISNEPGEIKIKVEDGQVTKEINTSPSTPEPTPTLSPTPNPSPTAENQFQQIGNELSQIWQDFLDNLSEFFGLKPQ